MNINNKILDEINLISVHSNADPLWWKAYLLNVNIFNDENLYKEAFNNLPDFRKEVSTNFKFKKDRNLSVGAWITLVYAMSQNGFVNFEDKINVNENGKPYISNKSKNHCFFNLSHSGQYALCAISNRKIGCDIQKQKKIDENLIKFCMNETELSAFNDAKYDKWCEQAFYRLWTLKESYMKMTSLGMQINPKDIRFLAIDKWTCCYKFNMSGNENIEIDNTVNFFEVDAPCGYKISLCIGV